MNHLLALLPSPLLVPVLAPWLLFLLPTAATTPDHRCRNHRPGDHRRHDHCPQEQGAIWAEHYGHSGRDARSQKLGQATIRRGSSSDHGIARKIAWATYLTAHFRQISPEG
jgi:hypothetical protein